LWRSSASCGVVTIRTQGLIRRKCGPGVHGPGAHLSQHQTNHRSRAITRTGAPGLPQTGDWRGLAEGYFGVAVADHKEGRNESALENFTHALKLIGDHPATFFLGKVYANMAALCWHLKRPKDGIVISKKRLNITSTLTIT
jgi:hypothetical protein